MTDKVYLTISNDNMNKFQRILKRCFDVIASLLALIVLSPVFLVFAIILKLQKNGSVIYSQERIGLNGKPFTIYKFRTLKPHSEQNGPQLVPTSDSVNQTSFMKFLRHSHLDELPQLWNVLKGDMSIVGPRPERQYFIDLIMKEDPNYVLIYQMRPGLTSEATLYNGYTDTMDKMLKRLRMDIHYLRNRTLNLDFQIMFNTLLAMLSGRHF